MTTVCIVEDDEAVAASLQAMLQSHDFESHVYGNGEDFLAGCSDADCVLMDVRLPGRDGLSILEAWRESNTVTPAIVMTGHGDVRMAVKAFHAGAQDFVEKPFDANELIERMETAIGQHAEALNCRKLVERLTPREEEVLKQVIAGHPNKVIAYNLGISQKTVELHRGRVMEKTEAQSLSHLVRIAMKADINLDAD